MDLNERTMSRCKLIYSNAVTESSTRTHTHTHIRHSEHIKSVCYSYTHTYTHRAEDIIMHNNIIRTT